MNWMEVAGISSIPAMVIGGIVSVMINRLGKRIERREDARIQRDCLVIQGVESAIALGEANAIALKNGKTNGETEAALKYAKDTKHKLRDFFTRIGVENLG